MTAIGARSVVTAEPVVLGGEDRQEHRVLFGHTTVEDADVKAVLVARGNLFLIVVYVEPLDGILGTDGHKEERAVLLVSGARF